MSIVENDRSTRISLSAFSGHKQWDTHTHAHTNTHTHTHTHTNNETIKFDILIRSAFALAIFLALHLYPEQQLPNVVIQKMSISWSGQRKIYILYRTKHRDVGFYREARFQHHSIKWRFSVQGYYPECKGRLLHSKNGMVFDFSTINKPRMIQADQAIES